MNIAYIVHRFPCLSEPFVMDQITGMLDLRHDVRIHAEVGRTTDPVHPQVDAYALMDRTRYLPRQLRTRSGLVRLAARALTARPDLLTADFGDDVRTLKERIRVLAALHGFVAPAAPRYDVVHCQFGCVARKYWRTKSLWAAKLVVSFRGHDYSSLPQELGPDLYRELFAAVDAVMPVCRYAASRLEALGCPPEKIVVHHSGTDLDAFAYHARTVTPGEPIRILSVARLEESKGLEYALRAIARLVHGHGVDVCYGIVGGGSLRPALEALAGELRIAGRVTFHGPQPRPRVCELMDQHHLFVLPSVTTRDGGQEGIPGTVREAMATGMPVVSTWHSGIPELVTDGVSGFLVPERDVDALADRLLALALQPSAWPRMGQQGHAHVQQHFDVKLLNLRLDAFYRHLLAGRTAAGFPATTSVEPITESVPA